MLFNSLTFAIFLPVVYLLYRLLGFRAQNHMLLVASYLFYGWWDWRFLFLMILSTVIDFWTGLILDRAHLTRKQTWGPCAFLLASGILLLGCDFSALLQALVGSPTCRPIVTPLMRPVLIWLPLALGIVAVIFRWLIGLEEEQRRKRAMVMSMALNLFILGLFKYFNFFIDSLVVALNGVGVAAEARHFDIVLPVGISFYTFQSMSYAIDIYRRTLKPAERFFDFALFVSFFPQLVAGPIERAHHLLPQICNPRKITFEQSSRGLFLIVLGLFKKLAIADGVAQTVDQVFSGTGQLTWANVVVGTVLFAVQIYCDFSGYSDIARGTAKLFGIDIMVNFRLPYFARSPQDFWKRWHISLSSWLSDYLYKPLGGNRGTLAFTCRNLMLTMLLGGLWHGAAWNYVLWGFYQGVLLCTHRVMVARLGRPDRPDTALVALAKAFGFGLLTLYGWLLFRASSFGQIVDFTRTLFTGAGGFAYTAAMPPLSAALGVLLLAAWEIAQFRGGGDGRFYQRYPAALNGLLIGLMIFLMVMGMSNAPAQFIYFQF